jgi:hypothetical protein
MSCECTGLTRVLVIEVTLKLNAQGCFGTTLDWIFECEDGNCAFLVVPSICQLLKSSTEQQLDLLDIASSLCAKSGIGNCRRDQF